MRPGVARAAGVLSMALCLGPAPAAQAPDTRGPEAQLPPHIRRLTWFEERADWSYDGKRILFLARTNGDVHELDLETGAIRLLTGGYPRAGYTRALYLSNGQVPLSGAPRSDPKNPGWSRSHAELSVLDPSSGAPPVSLDGSGRVERLTEFTRFAGYKASNPVVSDDGRRMAFQIARAGDPAGVGRGLFLYDLERANASSPAR